MTLSRPATDPTGAPPAPAPGGARWTATGGVGAATGLVAWGLMAWSSQCEGMECIGTGLVALAAGVLVVPLLAVLGLVVLRVGRPVRTGLLGALASLSLVPAAQALEGVVLTTAASSVPLLPTVVVSAVASGWAGLVVGSDRFGTAQRWATGLAVLLVFALGAATS